MAGDCLFCQLWAEDKALYLRPSPAGAMFSASGSRGPSRPTHAKAKKDGLWLLRCCVEGCGCSRIREQFGEGVGQQRKT